jgi:hypothetical protein
MFYSESHKWLLRQTSSSQREVRRLVKRYAKEFKKCGGYQAKMAVFGRKGLSTTEADLAPFVAFEAAESAAISYLQALDSVAGVELAQKRMLELAHEYHEWLMGVW